MCDTFCELLLKHDVKHQDRQYRDKAARLHPYDKLSWVDRDVSVIEDRKLQCFVQVLQHQRNGRTLIEERCTYIVIVPVPYDREQEYCQEYRACVGNHDLHECAQR